MKIKSLKKKFILAGFLGVGIFILFFISICAWIGYEVKNQCQNAKREYEGDCVEVLSKLLDDEKNSFRSRNSAIWALGQLGDKRASTVLLGYYTGNTPLRESLDESISQYELEKAINLTNGGLNITAFVWRGVILKQSFF